MNSIKLSYAQWETLLLENNPEYKGVRFISMKLKANGIKPFGVELHVLDNGTGKILSNSRFGLNEEVLNERRAIKLNRNFPIDWGNKND